MSLLKLDAVVKRYHGVSEEVCAIDGVSLSLREREMIALHGPSGSGKTTLLLLIATLLKPDRGTIHYRERDLGTLSEAETSKYLRREVGFVHQHVHLMPGVSALENASVKLLLDGVGAREARARAKPWLERLGLGGRLGHTSEQLSGGERQRVAIARALAGLPGLILADEPTGNLDSRRSFETISLLRDLAHEQGTGVVLVTHDTEAATLADCTYTLRDGKLLDEHMKESPAHDRPDQKSQDLAGARSRSLD
ncbi:MAG TPA: ABC transporter ATP-binding protein [Solirubrobacteraceae bacterium]